MHFLSAFTLSMVAQAAPTLKTHDLEYVKRNEVSSPFFYPENTFETFPVTEASSLVELSPEDILKAGHDAIVKKLGIAPEAFKITNSNIGTDGITHIYGVHVINGVPVDNEHAAVHLTKGGQIVAQSASFQASNSFVDNVSEPKAVVSLDEAVKVASKQLGAPRDDFPASNVYVKIPSGQLVYAHQFQLRDDAQSKWYQVAVDAANGQVVQVVDYVQQATLKVVAFPNTDPRDGFSVVSNVDDKTASPSGWNSDGRTSYTDTQGNNVDSRIGTFRADGGAALNFDTAWDGAAEPTTEANRRTAVVNNFYVSNVMHDIMYLFGFDERSGNFQQNNFGKGGRENDRVNINNQASGSNNANFATPPDGQRPTMNMFLWTFNTPRRDGSLENSIPVHEYGHGVSNRLTGGSAQGNCLQRVESRGMGEGWSDIFAVYLERKPGEDRTLDVAIGDYSFNNPIGIRRFIYSTNINTNPLLYSGIPATNNAVHAIGTIWATMLYEMYWNLVDKYGFSANWYDATQQTGNIIAMQLVVGGLKLQPCNPTFLTARDAILAADRSFYGGANQCLIWKAFAKRGLGTNAVQSGYRDGFDVPAECA
jgi:extracellular elastinolytic metalloproteinase